MNYKFEMLNRHPQLSIPTGNLRIAPYEIEQLLDVEVRQAMNEHSTLYFRGILKASEKEGHAEISSKGANVILSTVDTDGIEHVLFQGVVKDVGIQVVSATRHIEVHATSYSILLDIEKKSRSFQDKKMTYEELIQQVTYEYPDAGVIDTATDGVATGKFIMQHNETDWEFLKRLASHFNTGLICDVRFAEPKYFFGIPKGQLIEPGNIGYRITKDAQRYRQLSENGVTGLDESDFIRYEVETNCVARVGDIVKFHGLSLYVCELASKIRGAILVSTLYLMPKKGLSQPYQPNKGVVGSSYSGHILDVRNDQVQVALDTDEGHDPGSPCWFAYSTIYSSKDGSGWYCMPEKGDTIRIYFPDGDDGHAYAISSVHENVAQEDADHRNTGGMRSSGGAGGYSGMRDNPEVKSLTYGSKEVRLTPEGIYLITDNAMITMTDDGIQLTCENDIMIQSDKNIILNAEAKVEVVGNDSVGISSGDTASINIEDCVEIFGQEVLAN